MKLKTVSAEHLAFETAKVLKAACKNPLLVRMRGMPTLVLRRLVDDDSADLLIVQHPAFRASVRKARKEIKDGKGVSVARARQLLKE